MPRPIKKGVDYFSHDTIHSGKTLDTLEANFGNDGYAFWFKLLEKLGQQEGLFIDFNKKSEWLYFTAKAHVELEKGEEIMKMLSTFEAIDEELWTKKRIVWVDNFIHRVEAVYDKRGIRYPQRPSFCDGNNSKSMETKSNCDSLSHGVTESTQIKLNKTKSDDLLKYTNTLTERSREAWTELLEQNCNLDSIRSICETCFNSSEVVGEVLGYILGCIEAKEAVTISGFKYPYKYISELIEKLTSASFSVIAQNFYEKDSTQPTTKWKRKNIASPLNYILSALIKEFER